MRVRPSTSVLAAAFAGLALSACSSEKEPEKADVAAQAPETPKTYPTQSARETREAFKTVAQSNAAPRMENPSGNTYYTITGDIALRAKPEIQSGTLQTLSAGACLQITEAGESPTYAKVKVVGENKEGWMAKRALRPAPDCAP